MRRFVWILMVTLAVAISMDGDALAQPEREFKLGFKVLADLIPGVVGEPLEEEHHNPANGDSLQRTTTGLMVWRKADNWTAFTDGSRTWINGPFGLQQRPNQERFEWEAQALKRIALTLPPAPPSNLAAIDEAVEQAALDMINHSRQQHGVPPLAVDEGLRGLARAHAQDMAARNYFSHSSPEGVSPFDRMRAAGISYRWAAENLGWSKGYSTLEGVRRNHEMMMAETPPEDGHRRNILNGRLGRVGIGVCRAADGRVYFVSDFRD